MLELIGLFLPVFIFGLIVTGRAARRRCLLRWLDGREYWFPPRVKRKLEADRYAISAAHEDLADIPKLEKYLDIPPWPQVWDWSSDDWYEKLKESAEKAVDPRDPVHTFVEALSQSRSGGAGQVGYLETNPAPGRDFRQALSPQQSICVSGVSAGPAMGYDGSWCIVERKEGYGAAEPIVTVQLLPEQEELTWSFPPYVPWPSVICQLDDLVREHRSMREPLINTVAPVYGYPANQIGGVWTGTLP